MWTSKIVSVSKQAGKITIRVEFVDGTETFEEEYITSSKVDMPWLQTQLRNRLTQFKGAYSFADTLTKDQVIDISDPAAPTQAQIDRDAWLSDYARWCSVKRAIDAQVLTGNEVKVVELKTKVVDGFKPAYLPFI